MALLKAKAGKAFVAVKMLFIQLITGQNAVFIFCPPASPLTGFKNGSIK